MLKTPENQRFYSTVTEYRCGCAVVGNPSDVTFSFDLITRSSSLKPRFYNKYQTFLYDTISDLLDKGMNYKEVADWLNDNGYKTLRGSKFKNNHTHSIIKKRRLSDERYTRGYPSQLSNCSIEVVDKTLLYSV